MIDTLATEQGYLIAGTCTATDTNSYLRFPYGTYQSLAGCSNAQTSMDRPGIPTIAAGCQAVVFLVVWAALPTDEAW